MSKAYWTGWGIASGITLIFIFPIGILVSLISLVIVPAIERGKKQTGLEAQIDLLAKQAGIQYGTTEEKLEQLTNVRQSVAADARDPWDRT